MALLLLVAVGAAGQVAAASAEDEAARSRKSAAALEKEAAMHAWPASLFVPHGLRLRSDPVDVVLPSVESANVG